MGVCQVGAPPMKPRFMFLLFALVSLGQASCVTKYKLNENPHLSTGERVDAALADVVTFPLQATFIPVFSVIERVSRAAGERRQQARSHAYAAYEERQNAAYAAARQQRQKQP